MGGGQAEGMVGQRKGGARRRVVVIGEGSHLQRAPLPKVALVLWDRCASRFALLRHALA